MSKELSSYLVGSSIGVDAYSMILTLRGLLLKSGKVPKTQKCRKCNSEYPLTEDFFARHKNRGYGFDYTCKRCKTLNTQKRRHPEAVINSINYFECELCKWDLCVCDLHHIIPIAAGGSDDADNYVVLCPNCHREAHNNLISVKKLQKIALCRIRRSKK